MGNFIGAVLIIAFVWFIYTVLTMLVWNAVIPNIFVGAPMVNFWQAFGLVVLGSLVTGCNTSGSSKD